MEEFNLKNTPAKDEVDPGDGKGVGDTLKVCPLCQSEVRPFFINFNEKMVMCENYQCEYPFGHEELEFLREDIEIDPDEEVMSIKTKRSSSPTATSMISTAAWSEINRINKAFETEDAFDIKSFDLKDYNKSELKHNSIPEEDQAKKRLERQKLMNTVKDIKELTVEMKEIDAPDENPVIKNEKWIKSLRALEGMSGCKLLKEREMELMKQEQPVLGLGELKIDIDTTNSNGSSIKIEICNSQVPP